MRIANSRFHGWRPCCSDSNQPSFCVYTLLPISDRNELSFEDLWYCFKGVPPQSNCLSAAVHQSSWCKQYRNKRVVLHSPDNTNPLTPLASLSSYYLLMTPFSLSRKLRRLLPTLYNHTHTATTDCSKVPRGLLFPLEVSGLITRTIVSPGSTLGQQGSR